MLLPYARKMAEPLSVSKSGEKAKVTVCQLFQLEELKLIVAPLETSRLVSP